MATERNTSRRCDCLRVVKSALHRQREQKALVRDVPARHESSFNSLSTMEKMKSFVMQCTHPNIAVKTTSPLKPGIRASVFVLMLTLLLSLSAYAQTDESTVWIDVRSTLEHKLDHIDGDVLIPHREVVEEVSKRFPDKTTKLNLYCRAGGRAGVATDALRELGYTQVSNVGGIDNARRLRNIVEE